VDSIVNEFVETFVGRAMYSIGDLFWTSLSMDFIIDLLVVGGYDLVFVMVNRFTKMTISLFVPKSFEQRRQLICS
jgi:hypothetical protein